MGTEITTPDEFVPSINMQMVSDEYEPANISYMCMQMKQKFLEEKRLKT